MPEPVITAFGILKRAAAQVMPVTPALQQTTLYFPLPVIWLSEQSNQGH